MECRDKKTERKIAFVACTVSVMCVLFSVSLVIKAHAVLMEDQKKWERHQDYCDSKEGTMLWDREKTPHCFKKESLTEVLIPE